MPDEGLIQEIIQKAGEIEINDNVKELYVCFSEIIKNALDLAQDLPQDLAQELPQELPQELMTPDI